MRDWRSYVRTQLALPDMKDHLDVEIVEEIAGQLEDTYSEARAGGATEKEADAIAREHVVDWQVLATEIGRAKQKHAASRLSQCFERSQASLRGGGGWRIRVADTIDSIWRDMTYALRSMRRAPVVSAAAIGSLALGIGATTAVFSIADGLLLRTLPVQEPDRLALLSEDESTVWSFPVWEEIRSRAQLFEGAFAWQPDRMNVAEGAQAEFVEGIFASGEFFDVLGVSAVLGRPLTMADDQRGGGPDGPVAVVSHGFWQERFGGAADVIGQSITIGRVLFTVVGVTPPGFFGPDVGRRFDVVVPLGTEPLIRRDRSLVDHPRGRGLGIMIRLRAGQMMEAAAAALRGMQPVIRDATMPPTFSQEQQSTYLRQPWNLRSAATGRSSLRARFQQPLVLLSAAVALLLLLVCANVANLLLIRTAQRRHEVSVRRALGASRTAVVRQFLSEGLLLSGLGAALGVVLAIWGARLLVYQMSAATSPVFLDLPLDWRILGFGVASAIGTAILFGTVPAIRAARTLPAEALKEGGRGLAGPPRAILGNCLLVGQVALSVVLVVAAGLFMRTFSALTTLDLGFDRNRVLVVDVDATYSQVNPTDRLDAVEGIRQAVEAVPGVSHAAVGMATPVSPGGVWMAPIELRDSPDGEQWVRANYVTPGWFATYGTDILAGRDFERSDGAAQPVVAIVNEAFVRRFLDTRGPLGSEIRCDPIGSSIAIVGVVEDVVYRSLRETMAPMVYFPFAEGAKEGFSHDPPFPLHVSVREAGGSSPALLVRSVVAAISEVDPTYVLTPRPIADDVDAHLVRERLLAMLSGFLGVLALVLAALGVYGMTAYTVSRRDAEIATRMAFGASPRQVIRMVLRRVALFVGMGILIGEAISLWISRFAEVLLFGLEPHDAVTFVASAGVLAAIGGLAGWLPALRASRIEPWRVLANP